MPNSALSFATPFMCVILCPCLSLCFCVWWWIDTRSWNKLKCSGAFPEPRANSAVGVVKTCMFVFGGSRGGVYLNDLHMLNVGTIQDLLSRSSHSTSGPLFDWVFSWVYYQRKALAADADNIVCVSAMSLWDWVGLLIADGMWFRLDTDPVFPKPMSRCASSVINGKMFIIGRRVLTLSYMRAK